MSPSTADPHMLTVVQGADHLSTTTSKLYELGAKHAIPSVRIGRAIRIPQATLDPPAPRPDEPEVRTSAVVRSSHLQTDPREHLAQPDHAPDQRSSSPTHRRSTSDAVPMPERHHREQQASEPRQPNSRETRDPGTDLHPCATRRRVDAESPREARS